MPVSKKLRPGVGICAVVAMRMRARLSRPNKGVRIVLQRARAGDSYAGPPSATPACWAPALALHCWLCCTPSQGE